MGYKYEAISENSDATTSYNILGNFPVKFETFFREILKNSNSFRIAFGASNEEFGGWLGNRLEVSKDLKTNRCYWSRQNPDGWYEQIKDLEITKCWANGGWGQMSYIVTFAENATDGSYENEENGCAYCDATKANEFVTERNMRVEEPETNKWTFFGKRLNFCPMCGRKLSELPKEDE